MASRANLERTALLFLFFHIPNVFPAHICTYVIAKSQTNQECALYYKKGIIKKGEVVFVDRKKLMGSFNFKGFASMDVFYRSITLDGKTIETKNDYRY